MDCLELHLTLTLDTRVAESDEYFYLKTLGGFGPMGASKIDIGGDSGGAGAGSSGGRPAERPRTVSKPNSSVSFDEGGAPGRAGSQVKDVDGKEHDSRNSQVGPE